MLTADAIDRHLQSLQGLFSDDHLARVAGTIEAPLNLPSVNGSTGYVRQANIRYLFATLTWGTDVISLFTHPDVVGIAERHSGEEAHLANFRIYRTFPSSIHTMPWHVDNKLEVYDDGIRRVDIIEHCGLVQLTYLSDVEVGGLQIARGSHRWSTGEDKEFWDDHTDRFEKDVLTFNNRPRGTTLLYDPRCIHRGEPFAAGQARTALLAHYYPASLPGSEPILLNVRDLAGLSDKEKRLLNFGVEPNQPTYPLANPTEIIEDLGISASALLAIRRTD
jgi:hypothetical protein